MAEWSARVQASIDALTEPDQPDWKALAEELAEAAEFFRETVWHYARYHEAIAQHSGKGS